MAKPVQPPANERAGPAGRPRGRPLAALRRWLSGMGSPPWVRAPFLLFTFPTLLLAIATSVGILAVASASSPAFLSSAGNRAFQDGMAPFCPYTATAQFTSYIPLVGRVALGSGPERIAQTDASVQHAIAGIPHLDPVERTIVGGPLSASKV